MFRKYLFMMFKNLPKFIGVACLTLIGIEATFSNENKCIKNRDLNINDYQKIKCSKASLDDKFINSLSDYRAYKEALKPKNQFIDLFGLDGFQDQNLKQNTFDLWSTFQKESAIQIGNKRLSREDIDNTFNGTLGSLDQ